jgi:hypothetical protein
MRALPERVALGSLSTELGEVNICLYAYRTIVIFVKDPELCEGLLIQEEHCGKGPSMDHQGRTCIHNRVEWAIDRPLLSYHHFVAVP